MKDEQHWKEKLTPEEYHILSEKGTEPPFSGDLLNTKDAGMYVCKACGAELFSSKDKFDSGSGWPSFTKPASEEAVHEEDDTSLGMKRTETLCSKCGGHLGHVFPDGPETLPDLPAGKAGGRQATGNRYCINSLALDFKKE